MVLSRSRRRRRRHRCRRRCHPPSLRHKGVRVRAPPSFSRPATCGLNGSLDLPLAMRAGLFLCSPAGAVNDAVPDRASTACARHWAGSPARRADPGGDRTKPRLTRDSRGRVSLSKHGFCGGGRPGGRRGLMAVIHRRNAARECGMPRESSDTAARTHFCIRFQHPWSPSAYMSSATLSFRSEK